MSQEKKEEEIVIDLSPLQAKLDQLTREIAEIKEKLVKHDEPKGKGIIENQEKSRLAKIVESLKSGTLREQWEAPISQPTKPTANLLAFVAKSYEIRGKMGDTVTIPVVKAFDADVLTSVGGSLTEKTGIYATVTTTLKEAGVYTQIPYSDIEKLSEDLLGEIEKMFSNAILRAIDKAILDMIRADSSNVPYLDKSGATVFFDADWIAEALEKVAGEGKTIQPQDFILVINPKMYLDLYKDIVSSQALVYARPDVVQDGLVAEFMGVKILVSAYLPTHTSNSYAAYLIHKNAVIVAMKREMLFETERDTVNRKIKLTGTCTFGIAELDPKAICEIRTKAVS